MSEEVTKTEIALPWEWALKKAFWPVLWELWKDMKKLYAVWRDKIILAGYKKITDKEDWKKANLRVARDVFWNGSFSDESICAEYFGGIFAASRSTDWKDDNGIHYTDVVKSLSSKQLNLHYIIYNSLNKFFSQREDKVNVALSSDLGKHSIFFSWLELVEHLGLGTVDSDLNVLYKQWLLTEYETKTHQLDEWKSLPYIRVKPTTFGVLLYAISHNKFDDRRDFSSSDFWNFDWIMLPKFYWNTIEQLVSLI
jgi:hypothetical protein